MTRRLLLVAWTSVALFGVVRAQDGVLRVTGAVPHALTLNRDEVANMPHQSVTASAHDQSGRFDGVLLIDFLKRAGVPTGDAIRGRELAKYVVVTGADGYRVVFALADLDTAFTDRTVLLADKRNGATLAENALPYQLIVAGEERPARWVRQVVSIEVLEAPPVP
jgi:DMSO/TMAO reductase YedYZ molybdopterin-dependent catalytic subunit